MGKRTAKTGDRLQTTGNGGGAGGDGGMMADREPKVNVGKIAPRQIGQYCGRFDPAEPWPVGSVITMSDGRRMTFTGYETVAQELGLGGADEFDGCTVEYWNKEIAPRVEEVRFPQTTGGSERMGRGKEVGGRAQNASGDGGMMADRQPKVDVGKIAPRQIGVYDGRFDRENPWPIGSTIILVDGGSLTLTGYSRADDELSLGGMDEFGGFMVGYWNSHVAKKVKEVQFPPAGGAASTKALTAKPLSPAAAAPRPRADLVMVRIADIEDSADVRATMDEGALLQLTESVRELGMLEPVVVRKLAPAPGAARSTKPTLRLIAGHRRLEAARRAGEDMVEAKVYSGERVDDAFEARARLAENVQRMDLSHMDLARVFGQAQAAGLSVQEIAGQAHLSDDHVRRHLALIRLAGPVATLVESGRLPVHQAELIARVGDPAGQLYLAESATSMDYSVKGGWKHRPPCGAKPGDPADHVKSMDDLRKDVSWRLCGLAAAGWIKRENTPDGDPEGLGPNGGFAGARPCAGCADNTASYADQPTLFAGVHPQGSARAGYCTNKPCYEKKRSAWDKVIEKRRREEDKHQAAAIAKAKRAGLEVCEVCRKVQPEGAKLTSLNGRKSCEACHAKETKRAARYSGRTGGAAEPERPFPQTPEEKLSVALADYGNKLVKTVTVWLAKQEKSPAVPKGPVPNGPVPRGSPEHLAVALRLALAAGASDNYPDAVQIAAPKLKNPASIARALLVELAQRGNIIAAPGISAAKIVEQINFPRPRWDTYQKKPLNVPVDPVDREVITCLSSAAMRWGIAYDANEPTLADFKENKGTAAAAGASNSGASGEAGPKPKTRKRAKAGAP